MRTARWAAVLSVAIISAGCVAAAPSVAPGVGATRPPTATRPAGATPTPPRAVATPPAVTGPDAWLAVARKGAAGIQVIRAGTAELMFDLPLGAPTDARWSHLVTTIHDGDRTIVRTVTVPAGAAPAQELTVDGAWRLPTFEGDAVPVGLSTDGSTIVLVADTPTPNQTRLAVFQAPFDQAPRFVTVPGTFTYDAVSPDGRTIYVIEHLAAPPSGHYQVRAI
ncbi:MAG TPA: hypothetical protein VGC90_08180, partial [Candidatus Limnocylindrales bacterium]